MFTTIINDCKDDNARSRQESRIASLMDTGLSFIGVDSDLEASMQLIDVLDATEGRRGLVLVNVAPRGGHTTKWENGTPFGYFWHGETLVAASVDGYTLSAAKKLGLVNELQLLDTNTTAAQLLAEGLITPEAAAHIPKTQFRSFDFLPRAGVYLVQNGSLPSVTYPLTDVPELPPAIWHIDSFGNCKTTLTLADINTEGTTTTKYGDLPHYEQLRNLPDGETGLIRGSSGIGTNRFVEVMTQRGNFALHHGAKIGDSIFTDESFFRKATS